MIIRSAAHSDYPSGFDVVAAQTADFDGVWTPVGDSNTVQLLLCHVLRSIKKPKHTHIYTVVCAFYEPIFRQAHTVRWVAVAQRADH